MEKNYTVDFKVTHGNAEDVFETMKTYQKLGILVDEQAGIVFNDVRVPAGYLTDFIEFIDIYTSIVHGNKGKITEVASTLDSESVSPFLNHCSTEMEKLELEAFSADEIDSIVEKTSEKSY